MIYFFEQPDARRLADAVAAIYSIPREEVGVVVDEQFLPGTSERPWVLITRNPETETESTVLESGERFAEEAGVPSELDLALDLCRALDTNAVISGAGLPSDHWILVTAAGGHGEIIVDSDESDEGRIKITGLCEPIEGAPDVPLITN
jgi:hypothetical protein